MNKRGLNKMYDVETYSQSDEYDTLQTMKGNFIINNQICELEYVILDEKAIFQGDIILGDVKENTLKNLKAALTVVGDRWPNYKRIPYKIDSETNKNVDRITEAIKKINDNTNVKFVQAEGKDTDYILIKEDIDGVGSSNVGFRGGEQVVHLNKNGKFKVGNVIHELCHALGFWHEHSRQDRDDFIDIIDDNIKENKKHNFIKFNKDNKREIDFLDYDYESIMHYSKKAFSKNTKITIRTINERYQDIIGQRKDLSESDIKALNELCKSKKV